MCSRSLARLARVVLAGVACWCLSATSGMQAQHATPHLRPFALVPVNIPGLRFYGSEGLYPFDGQDGWVAGVKQQTQAPHRYVFVLQQARATHVRQYVLQHATPPTPNRVGLVVADQRWFVWIQQLSGPNIEHDWQLIAHDMQTGHEWVVDTARAEGAIDASCEFNIGGDTLVWTSSNRLLLRSRVHVVNLATRRETILATAHSPFFYEWPATDGRYVAWTFSRYHPQSSSVTSTVELYDVSAHRSVPLHITGQASQPVIGYGTIAWAAGPISRDAAGIGAQDLRSGRQYFTRIPGANRLSMGPCTVGFAGGGGGGIWDYCTGQRVLLNEPSQYQMNSIVYTWPMLVGQYLYMQAIREIGGYLGYADPHGGYVAVFHLSQEHPLYDFYH